MSAADPRAAATTAHAPFIEAYSQSAGATPTAGGTEFLPGSVCSRSSPRYVTGSVP